VGCSGAKLGKWEPHRLLIFPLAQSILRPMLHIRMRRAAALTILLLSVCFALAPSARAEDYPVRPIRILVPFSPGGPNDAIGRPLADKMSEALGQPVVVDNRPGAQGQIATLAVAKSPADGYTMLMTTGSHVANQVLYAKLPYDAIQDFTPVTQLAQSYGVIMVGRPSLPGKDVAEFIEVAKRSPGKFSYGHPGVGNANHIAGELFQKICGVQLLAIPYKGSGSYTTDVISGQVDLAFVSSVIATPNVQNGLLRALAITGQRRAPSLPDVLTFAELGYRDFDWTGYFGLWFPAGTPRDRVDLIARTVKAALNTPELKRVITEGGVDLVGSTPEEFTKFIQDDFAHQRAVMQRIGLQPQ
jgi:tripartite-type tricarboxylate transporter receptor subunit TctC